MRAEFNAPLPAVNAALATGADCGVSFPEIEPRLFSFNNPAGACPSCDGLGLMTVFDPERIVGFPSLSLASGAVKGWDRRNAYTFSMLESVARQGTVLRAFGTDGTAPTHYAVRRQAHRRRHVGAS